MPPPFNETSGLQIADRRLLIAACPLAIVD
jgi:hypothetical protein